jgi:hypothetical protein
MTYQGHVENGVVVLDTPEALPEGAAVEVAVLETTNTPYQRKPIWEIALELANSIPEEDVKKLPRDGSINHDHYLYGVPKQES